MTKFYQIKLLALPWLLALFSWFGALTGASAQCNNPSAFGTITAPTTSTPVTITTCAYGGEYSTINGCLAGSTYQFNATGGTGNYITIRQGTSGGTVLGFGFAPVTVTCTASGPLYLHYNTNAACGTESLCHTGTVACTSCSGSTDPCTSITTASCGTSYTATVTGAGLYSPGSCGFSTPGNEKIYSFTAPTTGVYTLQVTSTSATGYIDYFYKAASGGCNGTGWTCIKDIFSPSTWTIGTLTAGTTYYFLLDAETTSAVTQTFLINCPTYDPCASIPAMLCATPVTASSSGTGAWSPGSCGFSTPGQEKVYSFTPTTTGMHTLVITATNSIYADYFYKAASIGCNATSWTCIGDASSPESNVFGPLTAGTTYYILYDPESTTTVTQTFRIDCPAAGSPPPCVAAPTSPANGSNAGCPNTTATLSWPASPGATSYDVYFGSVTAPPFVINTASTTYTTGALAAGTYYWQVLPRNAFGAASGCTVWSFVKADNTAPTITCPASQTVNNQTNLCSAVVFYGSISASDNCSPPSIVLQSGLPSGSSYPVGVNVIVYRATDASGNTATCSFSITVNDVQAPVITCPANIVKSNDLGLCSAVTNYATPTATDNCSGVLSITQLSGLASGSAFPVGTTVNVWRAKDVANNSSTCSFTVKVNDTEAPKITCPPNVTKPTDLGECSATIGNIGQPNFSDNCAIGSLTNNAPAAFGTGATTVVWVLADLSGNSATCAQTVTVEDNEPPTLSCPANIHVNTNAGDCVATVNYNANASDNCPNMTLSYSDNPGTAFALGYSNVYVTAEDAAGNISTCYFQIAVSANTETCNGLDDDCDGWVDEAEDWDFVTKRLAGDGSAQDEYGISVAVDSSFAIVGANEKTPSGSGIGAAYILFRNQNGAGSWGQMAKILPPDIEQGDNYGASVAISGDVAAVGAPQDDNQFGNQGSVSIFYRSGNQWNFVKKVFPDDAGSSQNFGASIALEGNTLLVGASLDDEVANNAGAAYVFYRDAGGADSWGQVRKLTDNATGHADDFFGASVDLDGDHAMIGATGVDKILPNTGAAYLFRRNQFGADNWGFVAKMSTTQSGENSNFGSSVAVSGQWAFVGANLNDKKGADAGAVFIFFQNKNNINDSWGYHNYIVDYNGAPGDHFGTAVGMDLPYAVIAARDDNPFGTSSGRGFVYLLDGENWIQVDQLTDGAGQSGDNLGSSAAIDHRTVILGAPGDNAGSNADQGSVLLYTGLCAIENRPEKRDDQQTMGDASVKCFPVPFSEVLSIELNGIRSGNSTVTVFNALGQMVSSVYSGPIDQDMTLQWRPENRVPGIYLLRIDTGDRIISQTVVLER